MSNVIQRNFTENMKCPICNKAISSLLEIWSTRESKKANIGVSIVFLCPKCRSILKIARP